MDYQSRTSYAGVAAAVLFIFGTGTCGADSAAGGGWRTARVERAPVVDGRLQDAAWARAQKVTGFAVLGTGKPAGVQTSVRAVADDQALYIAVQSDEPRIGQLVFKDRPLDDKVWEDDSVEVFLDPDNSKRRILHLIVNAAGSRYDGLVTGGETATGRDLNDDETWNGDWSAACWRGAQGWNAEIRVPLQTLGLEGRHSKLVGINVMRSRQAAEAELSSWRPCKATFLEPMSSGELAVPGADGSLVIIDVPRVGTHTVGKHSFALRLLNEGDSAVEVSGAWSLSNGGKTVASHPLDERVPAGGQIAVGKTFDLRATGDNQLAVDLLDAATQRPLGSVVRMFTVVRPLEIREKLYAMFYRRIEAELTASQGRVTKVRVALVREGAARAIEAQELTTPANGTALVSFRVDKLPAGRYVLKASALENGKPTFTSYSRVYPYDPNPRVGFERNGFLTVAGKPFFPIGIYTIQGKGPDGHVSTQREAVAAGFNTTVFYAYTNDALLPLLDAAAKSGLKAFVYPTVPVSVRKGGETREQFVSDVKARMSHPALLGWYIVDEPEGIGKASAEVARDLYQLVRETDPLHPCSMVTMSPSAAGRYRDGADIMWVDPYPIPHAPADTVGKVTAGAVAAVEKDKPVWVIPQAFDWSIWRTGKFQEEGVHRPTDAEERCMTYLALVNGAKGIIYWAFLGSRYSILDYPEHWMYMKKLAGEMRELTPALLTPTVTGVLKTAPADAPLDTMLKRVAGQWYVFAVNRNPQRCSARITLPKALKAKNAEVLFEKRSASVTTGSWEDEFGPLDVHVYRLAAD